MATRHGFFAALVTLGIATTVTLWAAPASAQDYDVAGKHFAAGQERFSQNKFHTAAMEFQAAYDITKDPVLLFNVGEAWQKAGDGQKAVAAYRAYLKERTGDAAKDRADVEKRIAALDPPANKGSKKKKPPAELKDESVPGDKDEAAQWATAGGPPAPAPPPAPEPPPAVEPPPVAPPPPEPKVEPPRPVEPPPPPQPQVGLLDDRPASRLRIAAWASVASTIALLTTGAILGLAAQSRADEISRRLNFVDSSGQPRQFDAGAKSDFDDLKSEGRLYNGLAIGFYSAAGAMAITTTVLFVVDWKRGKQRKAMQALRLAPSVAPGHAGLVLGGAF